MINPTYTHAHLYNSSRAKCVRIDIVWRWILRVTQVCTHLCECASYTGTATTQRFDLPLVSIVANAGDQAARSHSGTSPSRCLDPDTAASVSQVVFDTGWCSLNAFARSKVRLGWVHRRFQVIPVIWHCDNVMPPDW